AHRAGAPERTGARRVRRVRDPGLPGAAGGCRGLPVARTGPTRRRPTRRTSWFGRAASWPGRRTALVIIDVHGHVTHPELFKRFPMPPALLDIDGMLERKAALGIELTIVGSPVGFGTMTPVPDFDAFTQPL